MGSNCDVLTLKRTSFSTFFVVGRSNHLPTTSAFFRQIPSVSIYTKKLEINLAAMPRGFESHRLRQRQHPAGCCFLFLRQTMQGLQGGIRTARVRRFASRRAKMPRWGIFRARVLYFSRTVIREHWFRKLPNGAVAHVTAPLLFVESKNKKHVFVEIKACATDFLENQKFSMDLWCTCFFLLFDYMSNS